MLLEVGENHVELLRPLGPGHAGRQVPRQEGARPAPRRLPDAPTSTQTLGRLKAAGLRLIDEQPRVGIRGSRVAFLHPAWSGGVLTEIVQPAKEH